MQLDVKREELPDGVILITVSGEVDMNTSPALRSELKSASKAKPEAVHLQMQDVGYFDSSGIAVLIEGKKWCTKKKCSFKLIGLSEKVRSVLELSRLMSLFEVDEG